ncbi:hypothetical protein GpartN1_g7174.t1 [Galdieria partita]|uniref:Major facilitator superfamily (MFS) profile domain-containing protein n=1 Tax=Galdieria partita TaxID=83374 RepID=A0A9C7UTZ4_9RHOD|nr:hypothetical protein GpartN1_g7174.t1 [Galdieria partita]
MYSSRWNVTLGATICHAFFIGLVYILPSVILSSVREDLHLSVSLVVLPLNVYKMTNLLFLPFAGLLLDRCGCRRCILIGLFLTCILSFCYIWITNVYQLVCINIGYALCNALCGTAAFVVLVSSWFREGLGTALGLVLSGFSLAGVLFPVGLGTLLELFGWRSTVFFSFLFFTLVIVPLAWMTLHQGTLVSPVHEDSSFSLGHYSTSSVVPALDFKTLLLSRSFWLLGFEYFSLAYAQSFPFDYLVTYLHEDVSFTYEKATIFLSILNACAVVSKLLGGVIGDYSNRFKTLVASSFLMLMGVFCLFQRQSIANDETMFWTMTTRIGQLTAFSILFGLGSGSLWNNLYALVPFCIGTGHLGFSQNSLSALHYLGSAIGSMMGGIVKTQTGSFTIDIIGIAAVCFFNLLVALYLTWQQQMSLSSSLQVEYSIPNEETFHDNEME